MYSLGFSRLVNNDGDNIDYSGHFEAIMSLNRFTYHPTEERILTKKTYNSSGTLIETVIYVDENFVRVVNVSGTYDFTYVKHEGQLVGQRNPDGTKLFVHTDHEGSTSLVTNEAQTVVENATYAPFGEILAGAENRFDYESKEFDSVVGDYDFHFRKYNPSWAIFTQPDTLIQNVYDPQSLNRYSFERNNPYHYIDPTGHEGVVSLPRSRIEKINHAMELGGHILEIWNNIDLGREAQYQGQLELYREYYPSKYGSSKISISSPGFSSAEDPTREQLKEWVKVRKRDDLNLEDSNVPLSLEKSLTISTQNTQSYNNVLSGKSGDSFYGAIASLGGSVTVRSQGISQNIISVYTTTENGKQFLRYQVHKDKSEKRSWEKKNEQYKPYVAPSKSSKRRN